MKPSSPRSCVAFAGKKRIIGVAAKNQQVTNMKNTITGFKRLLGRKFNDPQVQKELTSIPYKVEQQPDGGIGIKANYLDEERTFTPEQIVAMLFTKLKESASQALQAQVHDCVITCPVSFTNSERKALLDAAQIAGLNVLRLLNETSATALSYGFYKTDLPAEEEKPRNVIFVDAGNATLQVGACAFVKGKLKMLASSWDSVGGRDFDNTLADYFARDFQEKYKINAKGNARAWLRLLTEVEKIKKQMSANSTKLPLNIECFMEDKDVSSSIQRSIMEELCQPLLERVNLTLRKCLVESKLAPEDIHSIEIVGGSSRIPSIKTLIEQVFGKAPSTTLNQDEAVSRGAALMCAIMSPAVRVRDFGVTDLQNYPVKVKWDGETADHTGEIEVYPVFHASPFSRLLKINRREPFNIEVSYNTPAIPFPLSVIGKYHIKDVKPNEKGEPQEVRVKVRINQHGIVLISSASLVDKKEDEPMDTVPEQEGQENSTNEPMDVSQEGEKKKKSKVVELGMDVDTDGNSATQVQSYLNDELKMIQSDLSEKERVDAKNTLEEFVYEMRDKLQEDGPLSRYITENDRSSICSQLNDLENWLYEDGEDCDRETYVNKLTSLHQQTDPIKQRSQEYEQIPQAFEELGHAIQLARKSVDEFKNKSPKYDHLSEVEFINISEAADKAQKWMDETRGKFAHTMKTQDPPCNFNDIRHEWQTLQSCVQSVINRPKPKPATPQPAKTEPQPEQKAPPQPQQPQQEHQNGDESHGEAKAQQGHQPNPKVRNIPIEREMDVE
ncbi:HSPA4L family protein [Megaselia abdita]